MKKSDSVTSDFFHSIEFLNTDSETIDRSVARWKRGVRDGGATLCFGNDHW
jgi:hypothetical protein